MKKNILYSLFISLLLLSGLSTNICKAEQRVIERLYVATDRGAYIAGEALWLSVYCFDISNNRDILSDLSNVAYIEIHSSEGVAITTKIALNGGRGSGRLVLPPTMSTGNYRLIGYTKQMLNEEKTVCFDKVISIYNTLTSDRVPKNVEVKEESREENAIEPNSVNTINSTNKNIVTLKFGENEKTIPRNSPFPFSIINNSKESVTLNISVVKVDSIPSPASPELSDYLSLCRSKAGDVNFVNRYTPEYEGEIINGRVIYGGADIITEKIAFLSAANGESDIYTSPIDSNGNITFYTNSIFGDRDIVLEVPKTDSNSKILFEIFDPFVKPEVQPIPKLYLNRRIERSLNERSVEMQVGRRFGSDTLFEKIQIKRDPLLIIKPIIYLLDNYTRFPLMQEVVAEYISELRFRKTDGKTDLQVRWENAFMSLTYSRENTLVLIDGVPVFDHKRVLDYDPLKVKSLSIYGSEFLVGVTSFAGIVSLKTYKGNYPGLTFGRNVRIMDYQGVQYPCRFTAKELVSGSKMPDLRSTLYCDPQIDISAGEKREITVHTPSYPGRFVITLEGITADGTPFSFSTGFSVDNK